MKSNNILLRAIEDSNISAAQAVILASFQKARYEEQYSFIEWARYANSEFNKKGMNFFSLDDGRTKFTENSAAWDVELWKTLRVEIEYNFSEKKIDYIIKVMKYIRNTGHKDFQVKPASAETNQSRVEQHSEHVGNQLKIGVIAGTALGAVFGLVVGRPVIGSMLGAAIGGGIAHSVNGSRGK